ncbi:hypothetical protein [Phytohabitans houttuyneae]|uniref:Heparin-binding hemagglutinin n=1 Tax=Phytohabitans houttuyneae TaxID=1076126 RepID=A0A6V8KF47_9ACTN|nr:hypothetical protein [Phytohabitans houttuyneae]GFJ80327.1 hypothetical protein Phou_045070 [Phytohabitans houttuyneae]
MTEQSKATRIPGPLYAAAGAGDLAYQQLRKLPAVVNELSGKAAAGTVDLRAKAVATLRAANTTATSLRDRASTTDFDADRLRAAARRNVAVLAAGAQVAQERAIAFYGQLVAHGERVVGSGVVATADVVNSDIEATEPPAEVTATAATESADETEDKPAAKPAKATKRTRPVAK